MLARLALFSLAAFAPLVAAHGTLKGVWINGQEYTGPLPLGDASQSIVRSVNSVDPVKGTDNPDLNCGHNAQKAGLVADVAPGAEVAVSWRNGDGGTWVHVRGAVTTNMAACGTGGCAAFESAQAEFFKVGALGKYPNSDKFYMEDLGSGPNGTTSFTIPPTLPAGEYLVRHELVAMHNGMSVGGVEFYPACFQVRVSAPSRTASPVPSGNEVVTYPGGYQPNDPGLVDPNIYNPGSPYPLPGPALAAIAVEDGSGASGTIVASPSSTSTSNSTPGNSAPAPTATGGGGGCGGRSQKKKRVVKRIFQQGPLIKRHVKKAVHKREALPAEPEFKRTAAPAPSAAPKERSFAVRSRVMRGI